MISAETRNATADLRTTLKGVSRGETKGQMEEPFFVLQDSSLLIIVVRCEIVIYLDNFDACSHANEPRACSDTHTSAG